MWEGYFSDLMNAMWVVYGWEFNPEEPNRPNLGQVPLLRDWNEGHLIGAHGPSWIADLPAIASAVRDAVCELRRVGPNLRDSQQHGEALAGFLEQAVASAQSVSIEEWWGSA